MTVPAGEAAEHEDMGVACQDALEAGSHPSSLTCCCGGDDCESLRINHAALEDVNKVVNLTARMGKGHCKKMQDSSSHGSGLQFWAQCDSVQSSVSKGESWLTLMLKQLVQRFDTYVASAECQISKLRSELDQSDKENATLEARYQRLQAEKSSLEATNQRTEEEKRTLRQELDAVNRTIRECEATIETLEEKVDLLDRATRRVEELENEVRRLERVSRNAEELEKGILALEIEYEALQNNLKESERKLKETLRAWNICNQHINYLEAQTVKERQEHTEAIEDLKRNHSASSGLLDLMAHVKDKAKLLQDKERLMEDKERLLRMLDDQDKIQSQNERLQKDNERLLQENEKLRAEKSLRRTSMCSRSCSSLAVQLKKTRIGLMPVTFPAIQVSMQMAEGIAQYTSSRGLSGQPRHIPRDSGSSTSTRSNHRLSCYSDLPSEIAPSSVPSSPRSNRRSFMFDPPGPDASLPNSPATTAEPMSPTWQGKRRSESTNSSVFPRLSRPYQLPPSLADVIHESDEASELARTMQAADGVDMMTSFGDEDGEAATLPEFCFSPSAFDTSKGGSLRMLRRVISHESMRSPSSGVDVHTLKLRPTRLSLRPLELSTARTNFSNVTARPTISRASQERKRSSVVLRDSLGLPTRRLGEERRVASGPLVGNELAAARQTSGALDRLVSFLPLRWGSGAAHHANTTPVTPQRRLNEAGSLSPATKSVAVTPSVSRVRVTTPTDTTKLFSQAPSQQGPSRSVSPFTRSSSSKMTPKSGAAGFRSTGINQSGFIPGLSEYLASRQSSAPAKVHADHVDYEALQAGLEGP